MSSEEHVRAWRPQVPGVGEVLHAHFTEHAYPAHTHEHWTLLLVDSGGVAYDLDRRPHQAPPRSLTLLPPGVAHDGRAIHPGGFDKRVVYLDGRWLPDQVVGATVRRPTIDDDALRADVRRLHRPLGEPGEELEAESRLALICEALVGRLGRADAPVAPHAGLARRVRERLDELEPTTLEALATDFDAHSTQLIRAFSRAYGLPPHRYVTGRRIDRARTLLLDGMPAAEVAVAVGFYDQAHLTRHFRRMLGTTPGAYAHRAA
jgi:AraC-like DNA-binding protein